MKARNFRLVALLAGLSACQAKPDHDAIPSREDTRTQSQFQADIAPIFARNCATCHLTGEEAGKMSLVPTRAIESLVGKHAAGAPGLIRVVPGDPTSSYLIMKLQGSHLDHGGSGARMPFNAPPLPPQDIAGIREWISNGAKP